MGYDIVELRASGRVSRHNSEQDAHDNEAWNSFVQEVKMLADTPEYETISIYVSGWQL